MGDITINTVEGLCWILSAEDSVFSRKYSGIARTLGMEVLDRPDDIQRTKLLWIICDGPVLPDDILNFPVEAEMTLVLSRKPLTIPQTLRLSSHFSRAAWNVVPSDDISLRSVTRRLLQPQNIEQADDWVCVEDVEADDGKPITYGELATGWDRRLFPKFVLSRLDPIVSRDNSVYLDYQEDASDKKTGLSEKQWTEYFLSYPPGTHYSFAVLLLHSGHEPIARRLLLSEKNDREQRINNLIHLVSIFLIYGHFEMAERLSRALVNEEICHSHAILNKVWNILTELRDYSGAIRLIDESNSASENPMQSTYLKRIALFCNGELDQVRRSLEESEGSGPVAVDHLFLSSLVSLYEPALDERILSNDDIHPSNFLKPEANALLLHWGRAFQLRAKGNLSASIEQFEIFLSQGVENAVWRESMAFHKAITHLANADIPGAKETLKRVCEKSESVINPCDFLLALLEGHPLEKVVEQANLCSRRWLYPVWQIHLWALTIEILINFNLKNRKAAKAALMRFVNDPFFSIQSEKIEYEKQVTSPGYDFFSNTSFDAFSDFWALKGRENQWISNTLRNIARYVFRDSF